MTPSGSPSLHAILEKSPSEDDSVSSEGESFGSPLSRACNMVMFVIPIATMLPLEETLTLQTILMSLHWTTIPTPLPEQMMAHQDEQQHVLRNNIK
jgi:hypothetical protein